MASKLRLPFDGLRLRETRERRGLMQWELAELVDVDPSRISQLEGGDTKPMPGLLRRLADALDVEIDALLAPADGRQSA